MKFSGDNKLDSYIILVPPQYEANENKLELKSDVISAFQFF